MAGVVPGSLSIKVNTGVLKRDTEMFGKMSPFVEVTIGTLSKKTGPHQKGGKNPNWNGEILEFEIERQDEHMTVKCWDQESIKKNDLIGEAVIFL